MHITALAWRETMTKKLVVEFESPSEQMDEVVNIALVTQLMTTITRIGIRVYKPENIDDIIKKENGHDKEKH